MKIFSYVEKYDGEYFDTPHYAITIEAKEDDEELFQFCPEFSGKAEDWKEMLDACEEEDRDFYTSHDGDCHIHINKKHVQFLLSRHGNGYGGDLSISVPKKLCIDAFKNVYHTIINLEG